MIDVCIKNIVTNEKKFNNIGNFFWSCRYFLADGHLNLCRLYEIRELSL